MGSELAEVRGDGDTLVPVTAAGVAHEARGL